MSRINLCAVIVIIVELLIKIPAYREGSKRDESPQDLKNISNRRETIDSLIIQTSRNYFIAPNLSYTWSEAAAYCENFNSKLARIESEEDDMEFQEIFKKKPRNGRFWIGGHNPLKDGYHYVWHQDNAPFTYTHWFHGQSYRRPFKFIQKEEHCVEVLKSKTEIYTWHDDICSAKKGVVCKASMTVQIEIQRSPNVVHSQGELTNDMILLEEYIFSPLTKLNWNDAIKYCEDLGFNLISIQSMADELRVVEVMNENILLHNETYWTYDYDQSYDESDEWMECVEFTYRSSHGKRRNGGSGERGNLQCSKNNSIICQLH